MSTTTPRPVRPTNLLITLASSRPDPRMVSLDSLPERARSRAHQNSIVSSSNYQHFCLTSIGWQLEFLNFIHNTAREGNISKMLHGIFGSEMIKLCQQAVIKNQDVKTVYNKRLGNLDPERTGPSHSTINRISFLIRHRESQNLYWALCFDSIDSLPSKLLSWNSKVNIDDLCRI